MATPAATGPIWLCSTTAATWACPSPCLTSLTRQGLALGLAGAVARPLLGLLMAWPLVHLLGLEGATRGQLLLFAALPPAVMQFMLAERYPQEPEKTAAMVMLGNALAMVFAPLALAIGL